MHDSTIQAIEENIRKAKKFVEAGDALERLQANKDFKEIIMSGYFEKEAIRLVHLKADENFQTAERQKMVIAQMDAIGALNQYFRTIFHQASMAKKAIDADEETRDEMLAEELNND
jgi:hypothetical protein